MSSFDFERPTEEFEHVAELAKLHHSNVHNVHSGVTNVPAVGAGY